MVKCNNQRCGKMELLLVRYSKAIWLYVLQDLHCLQRFYQRGILHFTIIPILTLRLVRYRNACLRLFVIIYTFENNTEIGEYESIDYYCTCDGSEL